MSARLYLNSFGRIDMVTSPLAVRARKGFTFIELLISVAIVSFVGAAVYGIFSNGVKIWRRSSQSRIYERNTRIALEKFSRELRNIFELADAPFEGDEEFLRFPSLVDIYSQGQDSYTYRVGRVTYFFDDSEGEFRRKQESYSEIFEGRADDEEGEEEEYDSGSEMEKIKGSGSIQALIANVKDLEFSYCYLDNVTGEYRWKDDWKRQDQDSTPQAVTVKLLLEKDSQEKQELIRTVFIPVGTGKQEIVIDTTTTILDEAESE